MAESSVFITTSYLCGRCELKLYNPKILKCFHVFCLRCLDQLLDRPLPHRITCPLCESETYITLEGIDRLDDYKYFYHSAIEHSNMQCQMCDKSNMATSMCKDCQEFMCKECNDYHKTHKKFKSHNVVSIDIEGNETVVNDKTNMQVATIEKMCQEHDKYCRPMEEFCKACLKPVCSVCILGFHKGHKTEPLQTTVARARTSLREASTALKSRLPFLESLLKETSFEETKYNNHISNTRVEIKETSERLKQDVCRKIDEITEENISKLDSMAHTDKAVLESYKKEVTRSKLTVIGILFSTDNLLEFGDKIDLIEAFSDLQIRLAHYNYNYGVIMPDIFEPLMKPGSITLNQLYEAVGCIERGKRPMTNSFIAVKQQHSSHLVDNDKAFTNIRSFNLDFTVNSVFCPYDTDAMLVLADSDLKLVSANGSYKDFVIVQYDKCHVKAVGQTQNNMYFTGRKNEILCVFRYNQSSEQIEELNVKVTFTDACTSKNDTLLLLNRLNSTFYETDNKGRVIKTFNTDGLPQNAYCYDNNILCMHVTTVSRILIATNNSLYTFTFSGRLEQLYQGENSNFKQIFEDRRGNVFVADKTRGKERMCLFTPYGYYIGDILPPNADSVMKNLVALSIDRCGNLWIFSSTSSKRRYQKIKSVTNVYSYT